MTLGYTCIECGNLTELIERLGETFWKCSVCGNSLPSIDTMQMRIDRDLGELSE